MALHLWYGQQLSGREGQLKEKSKAQAIFRSLNYLAFIACLHCPLHLFLSDNMDTNYWSIVTCFLPVVLCAAVILLFRAKKFQAGFFISFVCVPCSLALKATYAPVEGIMLYPLAQSIICFFVLNTKRDVIIAYTISMLCFSELTIYYEYLNNETFNQDFIFLFSGLIFFMLIMYFIFSYLRIAIEQYHMETNENEQTLSRKNRILEIKNSLIENQTKELEKKQQLLISAAELQQKISSLLSHDARTSVISFKNIFKSFRKGHMSPEELINYIPALEEEADSMNMIFDDILSLSNDGHIPDETFNEKIDPKTVIEEVCHAYTEMADSKKISLRYHITASGMIDANPKFIRIILRNLISNAIKFTMPGGSISISNRIKEGNRYQLLVKDNGQGMSEEKLDKIRKGVGLTTTGTSNEKGTGLGLKFCREFVSKCNGILEIQSELGVGSTFSFTLPMVLKS